MTSLSSMGVLPMNRIAIRGMGILPMNRMCWPGVAVHGQDARATMGGHGRDALATKDARATK